MVLEPCFFKASILKKIKPIPDDIGYFDHAFIYSEVVNLGAKVDYVDTIIYHHELASLMQIIRKFYKYYGLCFIPALQNNKSLSVGRSTPRRIYFSKRAMQKPHLWLGLMFLYAVKAISACFGVLVYLTIKKRG